MKMYNTNSTNYGNYYNYYTATAKSGGLSVTSGNALYSLCPKGWKLPTGATGGEFQMLYNRYPSLSAILNTPVEIVLAGGYDKTTGVVFQSSGGFYWTSTISNNYDSYRLNIYNNTVNPVYVIGKVDGLSIRCIAR